MGQLCINFPAFLFFIGFPFSIYWLCSNIESNSRVTGTPAISYMNYNKSYVHFKNLPEIVKKIDKKD